MTGITVNFHGKHLTARHSWLRFQSYRTSPYHAQFRKCFHSRNDVFKDVTLSHRRRKTRIEDFKPGTILLPLTYFG